MTTPLHDSEFFQTGYLADGEWHRAAATFDVLNPATGEVLAAVARRAGLEPEPLLARSETPQIKDRLRANTEELIARGGFGSPTLFVAGDDMYFGNDRLPLVEAALLQGGVG